MIKPLTLAEVEANVAKREALALVEDQCAKSARDRRNSLRRYLVTGFAGAVALAIFSAWWTPVLFLGVWTLVWALVRIALRIWPAEPSAVERVARIARLTDLYRDELRARHRKESP